MYILKSREAKPLPQIPKNMYNNIIKPDVINSKLLTIPPTP
jgi:hypothetical protein